ncbi:MAG: galactose mutarotase [Lachnospiraceae bacterium]|nr:galactose mutarotase [Lachnospiraceae bacterium]
MSIEARTFGTMTDGRNVTLFTITNKNRLSASVTDLGAAWVSMLAPDRDGKLVDVILGYDDAAGYLSDAPHLGAVVGRVANRTGNAAFTLNGINYALGKNDGENNLHSGPDYYDKRLWQAAPVGEDTVVFFLNSPDGDQGYPGNAKITVKYTLTEENTVEITYMIICDQDTPFNMTNHAYFNLAGHNAGNIGTHVMQICADFFTPSDAASITTGEIRPVEKTPMDFRIPKEIGRDIDAEYDQLLQAAGYDHNWCLNHLPGVYSLAANAADKTSGRAMSVYTDLPGVQFYTANFLGGERGKGGAIYERRGAFCLETQMYPDAINKPQFASPIVKAGETRMTKTGFHFYTE